MPTSRSPFSNALRSCFSSPFRSDAVPCPDGYAEGVCPAGMSCLADTPCTRMPTFLPTAWVPAPPEEPQLQAMSSGAVASTAQSWRSSGDDGGGNRLPLESDYGGPESAYENPEDNSYFCGLTYAALAQRCLESRPCPTGVAANHCADGEGCFFAAQCTAEYQVAALRAQAPPPPEAAGGPPAQAIGPVVTVGHRLAFAGASSAVPPAEVALLSRILEEYVNLFYQIYLGSGTGGEGADDELDSVTQVTVELRVTNMELQSRRRRGLRKADAREGRRLQRAAPPTFVATYEQTTTFLTSDPSVSIEALVRRPFEATQYKDILVTQLQLQIPDVFAAVTDVEAVEDVGVYDGDPDKRFCGHDWQSTVENCR